MEIKSQSQEKYYVTLTVELSPEEVESGLARAYKKVVRQINVPGFRKGKFPRPMLEARYGVEVLYDDAIDALLPCYSKGNPTIPDDTYQKLRLQYTQNKRIK